MHIAAREGHQDTCQLLIEHGADIHAKDNNGWTPLHYAAQRAHPHTCTLLLQHGADIHHKNKKGQTALDVASDKDHLSRPHRHILGTLPTCQACLPNVHPQPPCDNPTICVYLSPSKHVPNLPKPLPCTPLPTSHTPHPTAP